ncbi:hypothetical protein FACS1894120_6900 [Clostridia bacterium]|nr:hypothetical protein FACS1894120_6900 [Clostridia bacterium]
MNPEEFEIDYFAEFDKQLKRLVTKKKFYKLPDIVDELVDEMKTGVFHGDVYFHSDVPVSYDVYKLRLPNPDANEGKSGGFRVIYSVMADNKLVVMLAVYHKKDQENVTRNYLQGLIDGYFFGNFDEEE